MNMKINEASLLERDKYIKYALVGGFTTFISLTTYIILLKVFNVNIIIANATGWIVSIPFAFFANKLFIFESKSFKLNILLKEYIIFFSGRFVMGIIGIIVFSILILIGLDKEIFGIKGLVAKFLVGLGIAIGNFTISRLLVFKKRY